MVKSLRLSKTFYLLVEHRENVSLAASVCQFLGVDRETAIEGMIQASPDPGALRRFTVQFEGKEIEFINAFAANDPESTLAIWQRLDITSEVDRPLITVFFNRGDRLDRTREFGRLLAGELKSDHCICVGEAVKIVEHAAYKAGLEPERLIDMSGDPAEAVFRRIVELTPARSLVVGIGNIVGIGDEVASHFERIYQDQNGVALRRGDAEN
jgi:poly-gamma-glutamate synthase PgsB/CapB